MARRKKNDSAANLLLAAPWQVSAILGVISFIGLRWLFPLLMAGNMFLPIIMPLARMASWVTALFFGFMALTSYAKSRRASPQEQKFILPEFNRAAPPGSQPLTSPVKSQPKTKYKPVAEAAAVEETLPRPSTWTLEALRSLEWKRFELVCAKYYEITGFKAETLRCGPDGGIDVKLFKMGQDKPAAIVQCKAWNANDVGVKEIRELLGVMTHEKIERGIFLTTGRYTKDAAVFGESSPIEMLDGDGFIAKLGELAELQRQALLDFAFEGDYRTPTCPSCGIKMTKRNSKRGEFFGCLSYPRCKRTFAM